MRWPLLASLALESHRWSAVVPRSLSTTLIVVALLCVGCATQPAGHRADTTLRALYEDTYAWFQTEAGLVRDGDGQWRSGPRFESVTPADYTRRLAYLEAVLTSLQRIDRAALSDEEAINAAVFERIVTSRANNMRFRTYEAPLNSDTFFWSYLAPQRDFPSVADYDNYIKRLADLPRYFDEHITNMRAGLARGFTPPAITLKGREQSLESYLPAGEANPFFAPARAFSNRIDKSTQARLRSQIIDAIDTHIVPSFQTLLDFMREEYLPNARQSLAANVLPDGAAFYQSQILEYTTLDLTPEEIHERGLTEVARIREAMLEIVDEVEFDGDLAAFFEFLRTDPQFYAKTPDELMGVSAYVDKRMAAQIHDVLGFLPRQRHTIAPVPDAIAPIYTAGRGGYGRCMMNTYNLLQRPLYTIPALTLHECSPGHSLQFAIAREAPGDIPEFRARNYFSGYGEGWGLYVEWLGGELGIYRTPYERFGQLTYEMWRACRLVIDTGVHHYGWSRDQALAYLRDNAALSEHNVTTEIDRYISWPAQALSYKLGEMLIRQKRRDAQAALGTEFDQRYFHDKILSLRSVPLSVLEDELNKWITAGGPNPYEGIDF
ncbi:MAG: DUF885 family protein [Pseudomonadota bacterium]